VLRHYAFVLEMLLRMRQACDHPQLVPPRYHGTGFLQSSADKVDEVRRLVSVLEESMAEGCCFCRRQVTSPCITPCAHLFCRSCLDLAMSQGDSLCPLCREPVHHKQVITLESAELFKKQEALQKASEEMMAQKAGVPIMSAKLTALLNEFAEAHKEDHSFKAVVFSQWTSMLDVIQYALTFYKIGFVRLDGQMSAQARRRALTLFRDEADTRIFLISLKAGGVGLNLTSANKVFLVDPWWNPASEDQAVDRIHRLGQTRNVEIVRLVARDTIEQRIIELQLQKRELINAALAGKSREQIKEERLNELMVLFK